MEEQLPSILAYTRPVAAQVPAEYTIVTKTRTFRNKRALMSTLLAVAIVLIILIMYYMFSPRSLARSLTRCGWTVYLLRSCGYCHRQMNHLEGFRRKIVCDSGNKVLSGYTDSPPVSCGSIRGYPYWYNTRTKESRTGYQDPAALSQMAQW